ncbi:hypothetical protein [Xanthocytophaga flava]|uniref:hypothetical protein n=1 Tax=Xanthocytophaga flava TaxID=3048013 RepID=UPI0028D0F57A|nr:hypothetical protein [Xanthocytophaga flavus]
MKSGLNSLFILFVFVACNTQESNTTIKKDSVFNKSIDQSLSKKSIAVGSANTKTCCIPDPDLFLLKPAEKTMNNDSLAFIRLCKDLNKEQVKAWIDPIPEKDRYNIELRFQYFKAVAFQKKTNNYSTILVMMIESFWDDFVIQQQNLITVDPTGKYIDGIPVCYIKNLSNSDPEVGSPSGLYQFSTRTHSYFSGDTIKVYQLVSVAKTEDPKLDTDEWDESYETLYRVNPEGKIEMIRKPKKIADERDKQ